jgi:integrase
VPKKISNALRPLQVKNAKPGRHVDGNGLHLLVKASGARSWVLRYTLHGKTRDVGLSRCPEALVLLAQSGREELSLAQARDLAAIYRLKVRAGIDPLSERARQAEASRLAQAQVAAERVTFRAAAQSYLASRESTWRNAKHRQQWHNTLSAYVFPSLGALPVADIGTAEVLAVLEPIWKSKAETANRVRGRMEAIIDAARARGHFSGENPARWRGHLDKILPARQRLSRGHHAAMPYDEVPAFLEQLRARKAVAAMALEFTILTAARTGEVLGATWEEVDVEKRTWTVPAQRMKAGREHRVPLSNHAVELLNETRKLENPFLFPGQRGGPMSGMAMAMLLRRMGHELTVHGFRSSFRDWASETTAFPHEVCEMALAHSISNKSEAAYRRGDIFDKRRMLMDEWAHYCCSVGGRRATG